ncbi:hypothetical protein Cni_G26128 [Canna indica]|uniref:CCHC-type domain-containing protein n=1 Tax=Canna indica TaxID=4628 RepID=A0AAQ3KYF0_9LILI|nr:hypothetical protein Cni_G26128 [Canna indica]
MIEVTEEDADFLSLVEAAEAAFIASAPKRQKLSSSADAGRPAVEEGAYMAALRGSYSPLWQEQQNQLKHGQKNSGDGLRGGSNPSASLSSSMAGGACFKCGLSGHWARDCDGGGGRGRGNGSVSGGASVAGKDSEVPEKACPCGSGTCLVLTSNTAKNPGRKFYRCPLRMVVI